MEKNAESSLTLTTAITEIRLLQANIDTLTSALEKLAEHFNSHKEKENLLRTELALIKQKLDQQELKIDDLNRIITRGTTREESLITQIKALQQAQEETSKQQQNKLAVISLAIALISAIAAIAAVVTPLLSK